MKKDLTQRLAARAGGRGSTYERANRGSMPSLKPSRPRANVPNTDFESSLIPDVWHCGTG